MKYSLNIRPATIYGLEINNRINTLGVTVIFPNHKGVVSLHVKNITQDIIVITKGTILGTLMLIPYSLEI